MRILLSAVAATLLATAASAGGMSGTAGDATVMSPNGSMVSSGSCHTILVGGCGYCINGKVYHL